MEDLAQPIQPIATAPTQGITETEFPAVKEIVSRYFETLSAEDFSATASLFSQDGTLYPPFDSAVTGREAIVAYLESEARGLQPAPLHYETEQLEPDSVQCKVTGKVQTPLFSVNVRWTFVLNAAAEIISARIKLLAGLEELLKLKPEASES